MIAVILILSNKKIPFLKGTFHGVYKHTVTSHKLKTVVKPIKFL